MVKLGEIVETTSEANNDETSPKSDNSTAEDGDKNEDAEMKEGGEVKSGEEVKSDEIGEELYGTPTQV